MRAFQTGGKRAGLSAAQKRGLKSKLNGRSAEDVLLNTDIEGMIFKRFEPYRRLTAGTIFKAQATEKAGCDYSVFTRHNAGMIEVKSREADRVAVSVLDETQQAQLGDLADMGRIALVLVRLRGEWYCVPYPVFKTPPKGKLSWSKADLADYAVTVSDGVLHLNAHILRHYS
jgi:hypothetical protein